MYPTYQSKLSALKAESLHRCKWTCRSVVHIMQRAKATNLVPLLIHLEWFDFANYYLNLFSVCRKICPVLQEENCTSCEIFQKLPVIIETKTCYHKIFCLRLFTISSVTHIYNYYAILLIIWFNNWSISGDQSVHYNTSDLNILFLRRRRLILLESVFKSFIFDC